jgi:hypothetical protein
MCRYRVEMLKVSISNHRRILSFLGTGDGAAAACLSELWGVCCPTAISEETATRASAKRMQRSSFLKAMIYKKHEVKNAAYTTVL